MESVIQYDKPLSEPPSLYEEQQKDLEADTSKITEKKVFALEIKDVDAQLSQNRELERRYHEQLYYTLREHAAKPSKHCSELWLAILSTFMSIAAVLLNALICYAYWVHEKRELVIAHIVAYGVRALLGIVNDYANRGRFKWMLFEIINLRSIPELAIYVRQWCMHYGQPWIRSTFRHARSFDQGFPVSLPVFIIQLYAYIFVPHPNTSEAHFLQAYKWIEVTAISVNAAVCLFESLNFFEYLEVIPNSATLPQFAQDALASPTVAPAQFELNEANLPKAPPPSSLLTIAFGFETAQSVGARAILIVLLVDCLGYYAFIPLLSSFLLCTLLVASKIGRADSKVRRQHDNPLNFKICKFLFGLSLSLTSFFTPVPFASSHSIEEWWWGYFYFDIKIVIESIACATTLIIVRGKALTTDIIINENIHNSSDELFYGIYALFIFMCALNLWVLYKLHGVMKARFMETDYTTESIIDLFSYLFYHLKSDKFGLPTFNRTQSFVIPPTPTNQSILELQSIRIGKTLRTGPRKSIGMDPLQGKELSFNVASPIPSEGKIDDSTKANNTTGKDSSKADVLGFGQNTTNVPNSSSRFQEDSPKARNFVINFDYDSKRED